MSARDPIAQLEAAFAALHQSPGAVAAGLGRAALHLALETAGVRGGDVLVPDFVCAQVLQAVREAGGAPVFYPVPLDLTVRPDELAAALTPQTRAAILVHYFGAPQPEIHRLVTICRERGVAALEDCSLALLAAGPEGPCGTLGDFATFSFTKNNWCFGGGMASAKDAHALAAMRDFRERAFIADDAFSMAYGRLCKLDFDANRPSQARVCAEQGAQLQGELARSEPRFRRGNFFDAGSCNLKMSGAAAARALEILDAEPVTALRRAEIQGNLRALLNARPEADGQWAQAGGVRILAPRQHNSSFVVGLFPPGTAAGRIAKAAERGITLRPVWPDYQPDVPHTVHAGNAVTMEVHPELSGVEVAQIAAFLRES